MKKFIVETSARHLHVTKEDLATLFGADAKLINKKELSQPGQFACEQRVTVVGAKGEISGVTILGPERPATQVEISMSDARKIGINAPIRESGDIKGSGGCKLIGPCGEVTLEEGVIVAKRHIHLTPKDALELNVTDKQIVSVKLDNPERGLIFGDVVVRVHDNFAAAMHIDTDESNAANCGREVSGEIVII